MYLQAVHDTPIERIYRGCVPLGGVVASAVSKRMVIPAGHGGVVLR